MPEIALILAAGFGTRLHPLTERTPKALLKLDGKPMLQSLLERLKRFGIKKIVINSHYLADQIEKFISTNDFGIEINISHEESILGTGGAIKFAERFLKDSNDFLVHNVDVVSDIDLSVMSELHKRNKSLATLAIQNRISKRPLIFDEKNFLIGRTSEKGELRYGEANGTTRLVGFCGIHMISSGIFKHFDENGKFDIFTAYFRLVNEGKVIKGYDIEKSFWMDIGTLEDYNKFNH